MQWNLPLSAMDSFHRQFEGTRSIIHAGDAGMLINRCREC